MFDRLSQSRDFDWFGRHPERRTYARLASEVEEISARKLAGISPGDPRTSTVIIVRRGDGRRHLAAVFLPTLGLRLPDDEETCAAIFEGATL